MSFIMSHGQFLAHKVTAICVVLVTLLSVASTMTYYVRPSNSSLCPEEDSVPCSTLSEYAKKSKNYFNAYNTTLVLLPGDHSLETTFELVNIDFIAVCGKVDTANTTITCNEDAMLNFTDDSTVYISGIVFFGCVNNILAVDKLAIEDCTLDGRGRHGTGLEIGPSATANIVRCTFCAHTGKQSIMHHYHEIRGALIVKYNSIVTIFDNVFTNNTLYSATEIPSYGVYGGAVYAIGSAITIIHSTFTRNGMSHKELSHVRYGFGGVVHVSGTTLHISYSTFTDNFVTCLAKSNNGGAVSADSYGDKNSEVTIQHSIFTNNIVINEPLGYAYGGGGAIYIEGSRTLPRYIEAVSLPHIHCYNTTFINNSVYAAFSASGGAVDTSVVALINIHSCTFTSNTVSSENWGSSGVLDADHIIQDGIVTIQNTTFTNNSVTAYNTNGGVLYIFNAYSITINGSIFTNNTMIAGQYGSGGVLSLYSGVTATGVSISNSKFSFNHVSHGKDNSGFGAVIYIFGESSTFTSGVVEINYNNAGSYYGVVYAVSCKLTFSGNVDISYNYGSLYIVGSTVTLIGQTNFFGNSASNLHEEGGALTLVQSELLCSSNATFVGNTANHGGAILATESRLHFCSSATQQSRTHVPGITITHNKAVSEGGGIYIYQGELTFNCKEQLINENRAELRGGGIHAVSSSIKLSFFVTMTLNNNYAKKGGGMYLEMNSKIYFTVTANILPNMYFYGNSADYGGALYIADNTDSCKATNELQASECFFQLIIGKEVTKISIDTGNIHFSNNKAGKHGGGGTLYGGVLDRCTPQSPFVKVYQGNISSATTYFLKITNLTQADLNSTASISSDPVRVCFCRSNTRPDCSYQSQVKYTRKGETFKVSLVAVDQINNTIPNSTIHAVLSLGAGFGERQSVQLTNREGTCTELAYTIFSPNNSEQLHLYADGPCANSDQSTVHLTVNFVPCLVGFADINERCECDPNLDDYITNCFIDMESVQRKGNVWFSYVNDTDHQGYITHQNCPFDYCHPPTSNVSVNLNVPNGADEMCAFNRSGKLCGACESGLSLSLGSSRCVPCPNSWLGLLIVFVIAGVALVVFLLVCNLTVAVGTINGLIFYANIIAANRAIFLQFDKPNFFTIFVAWLNLDFGFETCFYDGLDGYAKIWLQLVFPFYVLLLVVMVIYAARFSYNVSKFLHQGYKNPVAVLATLVLLSYTKFTRTIVDILWFTTTDYHENGTFIVTRSELVWLNDANIGYLEGKHIPLFIVGVFITIVGTAYTILLLFWQWIMRSPDIWLLRWTRNGKLIAFMEVYQAPYNTSHRYWIGMLLITRVILYLVSAVNVSGEPSINLFSIAMATIGLFTIQYMASVYSGVGIYKGKPLDVLENISLLNLAGITIITGFLVNDTETPLAVAYTSIAVAFVTFLAILIYHAKSFPLSELIRKLHARKQTKSKNDSQESYPSLITSSNLDDASVTVTELDLTRLQICESYDSMLVRSEPAVYESTGEQENLKVAPRHATFSQYKNRLRQWT